MEFGTQAGLSGTFDGAPGSGRAASLRRMFDAAIANAKLARLIRGNLLVHVPDVGTWTVLARTSPPRLLDYASEDSIDFAMSCDDALLLQLMMGVDVDFEAAIAQKRLMLEGDVDVFVRFVACVP